MKEGLTVLSSASVAAVASALFIVKGLCVRGGGCNRRESEMCATQITMRVCTLGTERRAGRGGREGTLGGGDFAAF